MEWLAAPLIVLAFAFMMNGFPNIHIGRKEIHKHYHNKEDED
jgi:hypothetical protein